MLTPVQLWLADAERGHLRVQTLGHTVCMTKCLRSKTELFIAPDAAAVGSQGLSLLIGCVMVFLRVNG